MGLVEDLNVMRQRGIMSHRSSGPASATRECHSLWVLSEESLLFRGQSQRCTTTRSGWPGLTQPGSLALSLALA
jgi:hypothetical protein